MKKEINDDIEIAIQILKKEILSKEEELENILEQIDEREKS